MQPFTQSGLFCLPDSLSRQVPGELVFDNTGVHLTLFQPLTDP
jgi:hypothetical protein